MLSHHLLGELTVDADLHTKKAFSLSVFGKESLVYLYIRSSDYMQTHVFTEKQEEAIAYFVNNPNAITTAIENELMAYFGIDDPSVFFEKLSLDVVTVSQKGELGLEFGSQFDDEVINRLNPEDYFTEDFGIVVYPEVRILHNEMECYVFNA